MFSGETNVSMTGQLQKEPAKAPSSHMHSRRVRACTLGVLKSRPKHHPATSTATSGRLLGRLNVNEQAWTDGAAPLAMRPPVCAYVRMCIWVHALNMHTHTHTLSLSLSLARSLWLGHTTSLARPRRHGVLQGGEVLSNNVSQRCL